MEFFHSLGLTTTNTPGYAVGAVVIERRHMCRHYGEGMPQVMLNTIISNFESSTRMMKEFRLISSDPAVC